MRRRAPCKQRVFGFACAGWCLADGWRARRTSASLSVHCPGLRLPRFWTEVPLVVSRRIVARWGMGCYALTLPRSAPWTCLVVRRCACLPPILPAHASLCCLCQYWWPLLRHPDQRLTLQLFCCG